MLNSCGNAPSRAFGYHDSHISPQVPYPEKTPLTHRPTHGNEYNLEDVIALYMCEDGKAVSIISGTTAPWLCSIRQTCSGRTDMISSR